MYVHLNKLRESIVKCLLMDTESNCNPKLNENNIFYIEAITIIYSDY